MFNKKMLTILTTAALIPLAANAGIKTFTATKVVDAKGRIVGTLNPRKDTVSVLVGFNGELFHLPVNKNGFANSIGTYYWTSLDCSGTALVQENSDDL